MRLVHAPDGTVDAYERALWLTMPFDIAFAQTNQASAEFTLAENRPHYTMALGRPHFTLTANRPHYTLRQEI